MTVNVRKVLKIWKILTTTAAKCVTFNFQTVGTFLNANKKLIAPQKVQIHSLTGSFLDTKTILKFVNINQIQTMTQPSANNYAVKISILQQDSAKTNKNNNCTHFNTVKQGRT